MPHGALDLKRFRNFIPLVGARAAKKVASCYSLILLSSVISVIYAPYFTLLVFTLGSAWHFGRSEVRFSSGPTDPGWISGMCRGAFVVGLPIIWHTTELKQIIDDWCSLFGTPPVQASTWLSIAKGTQVFMIAASVFWIVGCVRMLSCRMYHQSALTAFGTAAVVAASWVLHPLFSVGIYFLFWHSVSHILADRASDTKRTLAADLIGVHGDSLPLLIPTWIAFGVFAAMLVDNWRPDQLAVLLLVFFAILTPAHEWLQWRLCQFNQTRIPIL